MGSSTSRNATAPDGDRILSEHLATSADEEQQQQGGERSERRRNESQSDSDSEVEGEHDEERTRREDMSYYGDMLMFGGERFADVLGGSRHPGDRRIARPPRVHQTRSVICDVNMAKETLRLLPISPPQQEGEPTTPTTSYQVRFNFDSNVDCRIRLFFAAQERRDENNHLTGYTSKINTDIPPLRFPAGLGQEYVQPLSHPLDTSLFQESDLEYNPQTQVIPVIIVIEPLVPEIEPKITSQTTFATLLKCSDSTYAIKAVKVKIEYCGKTYLVHDIYGLDQSSDAGRECVICMTEARDTIVLPCRHMCLCRGCAEVLRYQTNKCPICRSTFTALLKIEVSKGEESDEETLKPKKKKRGEKSEKKKESKKKQEVVLEEKPIEEHTVSDESRGSIVISVAN